MKGPINPKLEEGDRVLCLHMEGETSVTPGTTGTVRRVVRDPFESDGGEIIEVRWDNGSQLSLVSVSDVWKKIPKEIQEASSGLPQYEFFRDNKEIFENFDWRYFREFFKLVKESGIVNMFAASPLIYAGSEHIERYYGEGREDDEIFQELLQKADEAKSRFIVEIIDYMQSKNLDVDDIDLVNRYANRISKSLLGVYINFYI